VGDLGPGKIPEFVTLILLLLLASHPVIGVSRGLPRGVRDPMPLQRPRLEDTGDGEQREAWLNQCCLDSL
jgi:hypothetical protein